MNRVIVSIDLGFRNLGLAIRHGPSGFYRIERIDWCPYGVPAATDVWLSAQRLLNQLDKIIWPTEDDIWDDYIIILERPFMRGWGNTSHIAVPLFSLFNVLAAHFHRAASVRDVVHYGPALKRKAPYHMDTRDKKEVSRRALAFLNDRKDMQTTALGKKADDVADALFYISHYVRTVVGDKESDIARAFLPPTD